MSDDAYDGMDPDEADYYCRLEAKTCRCETDRPDLCAWHGSAIKQAIESGEFWSIPDDDERAKAWRGVW